MASDKVDENGIVGRLGTSRVFIAIAILVSFSAFIVFSETSRGYRADVDVLVIPGGQAISTEEMVANVVFLSKTTGFRSVFFEEIEALPGLMVSQDMDDLTGAAKRDLFESMISVNPTSGSIISVRSIAQDSDDAKAIARSAALALFQYASRYYDVEEEVDFRIVDGPIVSARSPNLALSLFGSLAFGFAFSGLMLFSRSALIGILTTTSRPKMPLPGNPFAADIFKPKRPVSPLLSDSASPEMPVIDSGMTEVSEKINEPAMVLKDDAFFEPEPAVRAETNRRSDLPVSKSAPVTAVKQAPAPMDIPTYSEEEERFLKEFSFEEFEGDGKSHDETGDVDVEKAAMPIVVEESATSVSEESSRSEELPSVEEHHPSPSKSDYQRRLNELLRG
ncbi:MAG: hypothetical protein HGB34_01685 [Candidatus Moranbacteria bacterium]|nr:hypothetical protein [Candidatus Moranbacteria bacterium]NTW75589.1 hypothetical protein [Candidatus Moranbacteria bacterium]